MPRNASQIIGLTILNLILIACIIFLFQLLYGVVKNPAYKNFISGYVIVIIILIALIGSVSYFIHDAVQRID